MARRLTAYNLSVVLAGETPATPYEVLKSPRLGELLDEARRLYDYVVIDTPPIVAFPDCRILNRWVDGWLIVVAAHRTSRKLLEESLDLMEESKTVGFVFTHDERFRANARYYGAYYGSRPGRRRRVPRPLIVRQHPPMIARWLSSTDARSSPRSARRRSAGTGRSPATGRRILGRSRCC